MWDIWELFVLSAKFFCEPKSYSKRDIFRNISYTQKKWLLIPHMLFGAWDSAFLTSSWCCSPPGSVGLVPCRCSQRVVPRSSGAASPGTWWRHKFSCHQPTESERLGLEQRNLFYSKPSWNADSASMETKLSFPP